MKVSENLDVWSKNIDLFDRKLKGEKGEFYGDHWGLPENKPHLKFLVDKFLLPYIDDEQVALEIGSGGGRWTQYLKHFQKLYASDINPDMIALLKKRFDGASNIEYVLSEGSNYPGVKDKIDFVFSYGVFVHIDPLEIYYIFKNIKPLLNKDAKLIIQYSDQNKEAARNNKGFSRNNPDLMRCMIEHNGYKIIEEDFSFHHSSLVVFTNS